MLLNTFAVITSVLLLKGFERRWKFYLKLFIERNITNYYIVFFVLDSLGHGSLTHHVDPTRSPNKLSFRMATQEFVKWPQKAKFKLPQKAKFNLPQKAKLKLPKRLYLTYP